MLVKAKYLRQDKEKTALLETFRKQDKITIGDITVTPYLVSHSYPSEIPRCYFLRG